MEASKNPDFGTYDFLLKVEKNDEGLRIEVEDRENNFLYSKVLNNKDSIQNLSEEMSFTIDSVYKVLLNQTQHKSQNSSLSLTKEGKLIYRCEFPVIMGFSIDLDKKEGKLLVDPYLLFEKLSAKVLKLEEEIERRKRAEESQIKKDDDLISKEMILKLERRLEEVEKASLEASQKKQDVLKEQKSFDREEILKVIDAKVHNIQKVVLESLENEINKKLEAMLEINEERQKTFEKNWVSKLQEMESYSKKAESLSTNFGTTKEDLGKKLNHPTAELLKNLDKRWNEIRDGSIPKPDDLQIVVICVEKLVTKILKLEKDMDIIQRLTQIKAEMGNNSDLEPITKVDWKWDDKFQSGFLVVDKTICSSVANSPSTVFTHECFPLNKKSSFTVEYDFGEKLHNNLPLVVVGFSFERNIKNNFVPSPDVSFAYRSTGEIYAFGTKLQTWEKYSNKHPITFEVDLVTGLVVIKNNNKSLYKYALSKDLLQKSFYPFFFFNNSSNLGSCMIQARIQQSEC